MADSVSTLVVGSLPIPRMRLLGRETELATSQALLTTEMTALLTLTGPGGVGKTHLALAVARAVASRFADGVVVVPLASLRDPVLLGATIARALGLRDGGAHPLEDRLVAALQHRDMLLVLDNYEHLLPTVGLIGVLLSSCPTIRLLVTSRERLRVHGEQEFVVPPLPLPPRTASESLPTLADNAAVRLFTERVREIAPDFVLTEANAPAVAEICRRLDGLPLAIELAAARMKVLSPEGLLARLEPRLPLLVGGTRDAPERQRTLRDTIAWSYDLLTPEEQVFFRRLAVFVGGFTLEAAEVVAGGDEPDQTTATTLDVVSSLVDKSLLRRQDQEGGEPRFLMLETVREYAYEQLLAHDEVERHQRRHAEYFLSWAETAASHFQTGSRGVWLDRCEIEHDNLRAALAWSHASAERRTLGLRLAGALFWFWYIRGHLSEGRRWLTTALAQLQEEDDLRARAQGLYAAGRLAWRHGDATTAWTLLDESVAMWRALGDDQGLAFALTYLGLAGQSLGRDPLLTRALHAESVQLFRGISESWGLAMALYNLGDALSRNALPTDAPAAERAYAESLSLFQGLDDERGQALVLTSSGNLARKQGDRDTARQRLEAGLTILRRSGDPWRLGQALGHLGWLALHEGGAESSHSCFSEAVALYRQIGAKSMLASELYGLGVAAQARGDPHAAVDAWEESLTLSLEIGDRVLQGQLLSCMATLAKKLHERQLAASLGSIVRGLEQGSDVSAESNHLLAAAAALQAAVEGRPPRESLRPHAAGPAINLTDREREVLRLIAAGQSNAEIAAALVMSPRTASTHASHILDKLGLTSRAELIAFAHRAGLT